MYDGVYILGWSPEYTPLTFSAMVPDKGTNPGIIPHFLQRSGISHFSTFSLISQGIIHGLVCKTAVFRWLISTSEYNSMRIRLTIVPLRRYWRLYLRKFKSPLDFYHPVSMSWCAHFPNLLHLADWHVNAIFASQPIPRPPCGIYLTECRGTDII